MYLILAAAFVVLTATAAIAYHQARVDQQDLDKAKELQARFAAARLPFSLDLNDITRMFRSDGGAVCANPDSALQQARWQQDMSNGAAGPGQRPIISDRDIALADTLIIDTYCPRKLPDFRAKVDNLKLDDTAG
ncbi:hypothetical protein [Amycolatopsis sp. cmx-11-12]|uniref:hypothetical protein n=1 Tax=Amycolatopsis sp. cmx-11-12 TaxID=2785795 RepID=UPI003917E86A